MTMAQAFFRAEMNDRVSFELFVRKLPEQRKYLVVAGLGTALWWLDRLRLSQKEYHYLLDLGYDQTFLAWLVKKSYHDEFFTGDIWAIPEGTVVGSQTPILRVTAPRIEATLIESLLLSIINHQTMVASKAARIVQAAAGVPVWDFSLRRLHGPEAAIGVARAAYIAGLAGTATLEAGRVLGIPTTGTMAHHYVMAWGEENEQRAFEEFLLQYPDDHVLLVDTYDTFRGVERAIIASTFTHIPLRAIRIDSGDFAKIVPLARKHLDFNGCENTRILISGDLDEYKIQELAALPIDGYGVGTMLGTSADAPHLGGVYKLVEQHEREPRFVMKTAQLKQTDPGCHQVWREGYNDTLALANEEGWSHGPMKTIPLLQPIVFGGKRAQPGFAGQERHDPDNMEEARERCRLALLRMPKDGYILHRSTGLLELRRVLGDQGEVVHEEEGSVHR